MPQMAVFPDHTLFVANTQSAATLTADAQLLAGSPAAARHFVQQSLDVLVTGRLLGVELIAPGARDGGIAVVAGLLREAAASANADSSRIGLTVRSGNVALREAWHARTEQLGAGPLYVAGGLPEAPADWDLLWELRDQRDLRLAAAAEVTSACPLLAAEPATVIEPGLQVQAPVSTAWVGRRIWLPDFLTADGHIDERGLLRTAALAVEAGEQAFAPARWATARMRHDAWLNRRLAIELAGFGTLVAMLGLDPAEFSTLLMLSRLVARLREALLSRSRQLADRFGPVPVLEQGERMLPMADERLREGWLRRWRQAVASSAQRHRNLLVLSPWSLFPDGEAAPFRYANLAPLLRYADACAFPALPDLSAWTRGEFVNFHRQVAAVLQQRSAQRQIAEPA